MWTAGPRASALNEQLGVSLDALGRVPVDSQLATGSTASGSQETPPGWAPTQSISR